jgi:hypothetical protein
MPSKPRAMSDDKALAAVPLDEPVLVMLGPDDGEGNAPERPEPEPERKPPQRQAKPEVEEEDPTARVQEQLKASETARKLAEQQASDERAKREQTERELREARARTADSESDAVASGLTAAKGAHEAALADVERAFEEGNAKKLADAQGRLSLAAADIREYERAQLAMADKRKEREKEQSQPAQDLNQRIDNNPALLQSEKDWLKAHSETLIDRAQNTLLDAAYVRAMQKGLHRGTAAYFQFIESELGYASHDDNPEPTGNGRTPPVSAPVTRESRSALSNTRTAKTSVELSPEQRDFARSMGLTDKEYAAGFLQMEAEKNANPEKFARR